MLHVTEETVIFTNKPGIQLNEKILVSPDPSRKGSRPKPHKYERSAQNEIEAGLFLSRPERSETPNLGTE